LKRALGHFSACFSENESVLRDTRKHRLNLLKKMSISFIFALHSGLFVGNFKLR
jgi:hypothetical protein